MPATTLLSALAIAAILAPTGPASAQTVSARPHAAPPAAAAAPGATAAPAAAAPKVTTAPAPPAPTTAAPTTPEPTTNGPTTNGPTTAAPTPPVPESQRTTATYGDWILRCLRPEHGAPTCEVVQAWSERGNPLAQLAIGRPPGEPMRLTLVVVPNVRLTVKPRVLGGERDTSTPAIELDWQRCVSGACLADAALTDDQLRRLRSRTDSGRVIFQDANGREAALPLVPRGLAQGLDALAREEQGAR